MQRQQPVFVLRLDGVDAELARPRDVAGAAIDDDAGQILAERLQRVAIVRDRVDLEVDAIGLRRAQQTERVRLFVQDLQALPVRRLDGLKIGADQRQRRGQDPATALSSSALASAQAAAVEIGACR